MLVDVVDRDIRKLTVHNAQYSASADCKSASAAVVIATPCQHNTSRLLPVARC